MTTEERLEKLERELAAVKHRNRWLLIVMVLTIGGLGIVWTLTKTTSAAYAQEAEALPKVIRANVIYAKMFVVKDENGETRAGLSETELVLFDKNGKNRAILSVDKDGPRLLLSDENGKPRVALTVDKDGAVLGLRDENGKNRAMLGKSQAATPDGKTITYPESSLLLFGPDEKVLWSAPR